MICIVLTVFDICGAAILVLLRPVKDDDSEKNDVSWLFCFQSFCLSSTTEQGELIPSKEDVPTKNDKVM